MWMLKDWCFWTVMLEKTLESPLGCQEIQPVHPKGNHSWILTGRTDAEAETPVLWPSDVKNWLIGKDWMLGKMEGRRRRGRQRMRWMDGITDWTWVWANFGRQGSLVCCSPWGCKESGTIERLNNNNTYSPHSYPKCGAVVSWLDLQIPNWPSQSDWNVILCTRCWRLHWKAVEFSNTQGSW